MFTEGNVIVLESKATNKTLRINSGSVEGISGIGGRGKLAQFVVHVRRPSVVALQSVSNEKHWLGIIDDRLIGTVSIRVHAGACRGNSRNNENTYQSGRGHAASQK
jgi:acyl CoA:acetate/3-ketoacid CoA transferase alpha subunit